MTADSEIRNDSVAKKKRDSIYLIKNGKDPA